MFERTVDGVDLRFHLAGINNQNFLMQDEQTGTYWQQITGLAISGPMTGKRLTLVPADELSYRIWKSEQPNGTVLNDVPKFVKEYAPRDWDVDMDKVPTVISYAQAGLRARDLMLGIRTSEAARAYPYNLVLKQQLVQDRVGSQPIVLVVAPDHRSVRVFQQHIEGVAGTPQFYRVIEQAKIKSGVLFLDSESGSEWNFKGCAISGALRGRCLSPVNVIKDYWFDWRNYNPSTSVFGVSTLK